MMDIADAANITTFFDDFLSFLGIVDGKNLIYLLILFAIVGYIGINLILFFSDNKSPKNWLKLNKGLQLIVSILIGAFAVYSIFVIHVWNLYKQVKPDAAYLIMMWFMIPITLIIIMGILARFSVKNRIPPIRKWFFMKLKSAELICLSIYLILFFFLMIFTLGIAVFIDKKMYAMIARVLGGIFIIIYVNKFTKINSFIHTNFCHHPTKEELIFSAEKLMRYFK